ncbi:MAG: CPBP family intramembrane metalloprotease [Candidatus Eremiobacteraeota bacterium]|nr:CPBP family intramembrane metalloprotease [Candidatus Eremiobacteraeota bacterium]MBC5827513.1 CPBP family intramembrane metalloprotease [Candidatus Eremiobacteraeota bacterium]
MLVLWAVTALALEALRLHGEGPADVGFRPPRHLQDVLAALLAVGLLLAITAGPRGAVPRSYAERVAPVLPHSPVDWLWFVPLAATAGMCEEFLYRGYALTQIATLTGSLPAGVVISTAAFGLAHSYQGRLGMMGTALSGLLYAAVFLWSGSLIPCMAGHFAHDIAGAMILLRRLKAGVGEETGDREHGAFPHDRR